MTALTFITLLFALLDLICIFAVIFFERKNPSSTIAWTLVLIFLPFAGFLAYGMFGSGFHVNKRKRFAMKQLSDRMNKGLFGEYIDNADGCRQCQDASYERLVSYLGRDGMSIYTEDNSAEVFTSGQECFDRMKQDMLAAKSSIHMLYYIYRNDSLGREITDILIHKAKRGVTVRLIYDSLGSFLATGRMFKRLSEAGGHVEAFSPLFSKISSHLRLNYRNHRKITVVDGTIGYVGGMNVGKEYVGMDKRLRPWRDTTVRIEGDAARLLQERFLLDWVSVTDKELDNLSELFPMPRKKSESDPKLGVQIVSSGPDTAVSYIKYGLLEMLYSARKNVFIQTPYFTPDDGFLDALRIAASSGVDVRLMLPGVSDNQFVAAATYCYAQQLLESGVRILKYDGFLHAKTMVYDGLAATIGTANIGNRSFALNFEVNAFFYNRDFAAHCEDIFLADEKRCTEVDQAWFDRLNAPTRITFGLSRLFAPLM